MTEYYKRCKHCQIVYTYQGSGDGCQRAENDPRYCPECMKIINKALSKISIKRKRVWEETDEITEKEFEELKEERIKYCKKHNILDMRRVIPTSIRHDPKAKGLKVLDQELASSIKNEAGVEYILSKWKNNWKPVIITVAMEKDLKTNKIIGHWIDI